MPSKDTHLEPASNVAMLLPDDPRFASAFCLVLTGATACSPAVDDQRRNLDILATRNGILPSMFVACDTHNQIQAAAIHLESPGRSGLVYLSPDMLNESMTQSLLNAVIDHAQARKINILQTLLLPGDARRARLLKDTGFQYLAELIYLALSVGKPGMERFQFPSRFKVQTYQAESEATFIRALEGTYQNSLDCPELTPMRSAEDAFAGHKATGLFDPRGYFLVTDDSSPVAILLTSEVLGSSALEIVYMGVLPQGRRCGLGSALLGLAMRRAQEVGVTSVTLAVDGTNEPARRLYANAGYVDETRRRAWIRKL